MGVNKFNNNVERTVWKNKNGSYITTVTGLLEVGEYEVEKSKDSDGRVVLKYTPKDSSK